MGPSGPATTTIHGLAPADKVPGVGSLSRADSAEAREHARGRAVEIASASEAVDVPQLAVVGVTWDAGSAPGGTVQYRTAEAGIWSEWRFLEAEGDGPDPAEAKEAAAKTGGAREGSAPLVTTDADEIQVRVIAEADSSPVDAELMVVEPGASNTSSVTSSATPTASRTIPSTSPSRPWRSRPMR